jgi:hypothetical protein
MLKDPGLLATASYITVERDETKGRIKFQDPTGSLVYLIERMDYDEPVKLTYHIENKTSNMCTRTGKVELSLEKINEAKSNLPAKAISDPTHILENMKRSVMYLPAEQLSGYLSFRQDLGMLMG